MKEKLDADPIPLLRQAEGHRVRQKTPDLKPGAETSTRRTSKTVENEVPPVVEAQLHENPENKPPPPDLPTTEMSVANKTIPLMSRVSAFDEFCYKINTDSF